MRTVRAGFRTEGFGPFAYLFREIGRSKYDLDLQPAALFNREGAEEDLMSGKVAFLLGQHFSPVAANAHGTPICWLTVPGISHKFFLITRPDIQSPEDLEGKRFLLPEARCPALNAILTLRKMGLDGKVNYLNSVRLSNPPRDENGRALHNDAYFLNEVKEGRADCVMGYQLDLPAQRMGLRVFESPKLDIVSGPLITTTPGFAYKDPELTRDVLRAYLEAIYTFKTDREIVLDVLLQERDRLVSMGFDVNDQEVLDHWYEHHANSLQPRPFPTPAALEWTEQKAAIDYPEAAAGGVNAVRTIDMHFLQSLDREGFLDNLWSKVKTT